MAEEDDRSAERAEMVERIMLHGQVAAGERGGITLSPRVLEAMGTVPRHEFVPADVAELAYADSPLPIGHGKTISQPFIVALMVELLDVQPTIACWKSEPASDTTRPCSHHSPTRCTRWS